MKATIALLALLLALPAFACDERSPASPDAADLTGAWTGVATYPNSPFQLSLRQDDGILTGRYNDTLDRSLSVSGTSTNPTFAIVVDFGDAKLNLKGTFLDARTAEGVMFTSALGNREYPFTMTR